MQDDKFWNVWEDLPWEEAEAVYESVFREVFNELAKGEIEGNQVTPKMERGWKAALDDFSSNT